MEVIGLSESKGKNGHRQHLGILLASKHQALPVSNACKNISIDKTTINVKHCIRVARIRQPHSS